MKGKTQKYLEKRRRIEEISTRKFVRINVEAANEEIEDLYERIEEITQQSPAFFRFFNPGGDTYMMIWSYRPISESDIESVMEEY